MSSLEYNGTKCFIPNESLPLAHRPFQKPQFANTTMLLFTFTRQKKQAAMCIAEERAKSSLNTRSVDGLMSSRSDATLHKQQAAKSHR
jgi:hypothetical protein